MLGLKEDPKSISYQAVLFMSRPWLFNRNGIGSLLKSTVAQLFPKSSRIDRGDLSSHACKCFRSGTRSNKQLHPQPCLDYIPTVKCIAPSHLSNRSQATSWHFLNAFFLLMLSLAQLQFFTCPYPASPANRAAPRF